MIFPLITELHHSENSHHSENIVFSTSMWGMYHLFDSRTTLGVLRDLRTLFKNPGKSLLSLDPALRTSIMLITASQYYSDQISSKLLFLLPIVDFNIHCCQIVVS